MRSIIFSIIILCFWDVNVALDNGLALTPPMGWMAWERFRCITDCINYPDECINEELFRTMADLMVSGGYLEVGYEYIIIDDCWTKKERDENNKLQADPDRFPSGIKALADFVHSKGLKLGIYADYGNLTCAGYPGSLGYLEIDAQTFAEWEVDYLKLDGCYSDGENREEGYGEMGAYLNATGRPIMYSCSWPAYEEYNDIQSNYAALAKTCNLWRNWIDIQDSWESVSSIISWFSENQDRLANFSAPGHWNDPDMLIIGNYGLSYDQSLAQMAIWSVMAAPLIMSVDLRTISASHKEILVNRDAIAINQDKLGIQGLLVKTVELINIWTKPILPYVNGSSAFAIAFASNRVDGYIYKLDVPLKDIGLTHSNGYTVKNIYSKEPQYSLTADGVFTVRVKPTGVVFLKAVPIEQS